MGLLGLFGSGAGKEVKRILRDLGGCAEEDKEDRSSLCEELAAMEEEAIEPLERWLTRSVKVRAPEWMILDVSLVLVKAGDDGLMTLAPFARQDPPERRCAALLALGASSRVEALPVCLEALRCGDDAVVAAACTALAQIGSPDAVPDLAALLAERGVSRSVRAGVCKTLATIKGPEATKALVGAASSADLADILPRCIAKMGPLVVPAALSALKTGDPAVRKVMVKTLCELGSIGGKESTGGLAVALRDADPEIREMAAATLAKLGQFQPMVEALRAENFDSRFVIQALGRMGSGHPELMQAYSNLLASLGHKVTTGSMFAVEQLKDAGHLPAAMRYLEQVTQFLADGSDFMEPAIRLKQEVRQAMAARRARR